MIDIPGLIFDSHCHYDDIAFDEDRFDLLDRLLIGENAPVDKMLHASVDEESALFGIEFAQKYAGAYTSIGFHPENLESLPDDYMDRLEELYKKASQTEKLAAVGEIGLDYHYDGFDKDLQIKVFRNQIEFALKKSLPIIVHCRDAVGDCMDILHEYAPEGVMHCFSGSPETAAELIDMGMYIGFTGALAFKNAKKSKKVLEGLPLDKFLLETDCPYMAPPPFRGQRCDSSMIEETAKVAAEIKGKSVMEILGITNANACRLFGIG